jgi:type III restriction enzyme
MGINDLTLAKELTKRVEEASAGIETGVAPILDQVTPITAELLKWWFQQDFMDLRDVNFHAGQRQALLNTIYAHEVLKTSTLAGLYGEIAPTVMLESAISAERIRADKNAYPKYCLKMATGTGKTWVMQAVLVWQVLNANREETPSARYTKNFLIVAPGLIVYDRILDAFMGKEREGARDFAISDLSTFRDLFIPEPYREEIFRFVTSAFCTKEEIGRKVTSGGLIGLTNWQAIKEESDLEDDDDDIEAPGITADPARVVQDILPLTPGTNTGNDLNVLNRQYERGNTLEFLKALPDLMVFNDEAHRIHEVKREGEVMEVEWQKSLTYIAEPKGAKFVQVDFTATPYNQVGTGQNVRISYFPHIIVDFDLKTAMRSGLVKSLVLDKRSEIGALDNDSLEFKADRDEDGNPILADGQRVMLRAGLAKLRKLEAEFAKIDPDKHPKMLVMCEDTNVTPLVEDFLKLEGLAADEILRVDSNRKGELKKDDWAVLRERLFDMDRHKNPRVVVSVLMLREGFDVNNICVIVPLRSTQARILLEQTIGRGLRLMWRGEEFDDTKRENRALIRSGKPPNNMIDVLSIVEHPAFQSFYDELMKEGLASEVTEDDDSTSSTGDLIAVDLRDGYQPYDFAIPFVLREREETLGDRSFDSAKLAPFDAFNIDQLKKMIGKGDRFVSEDVEAKTRFGDYRVQGGVMTATGYNDYISRIVRRIGELLTQPLTKSAKDYANKSQFPYLQVNKPQLAGWIDGYIRTRLFGATFAPLDDENWRLLLNDAVTAHIIKVVAQELLRTEHTDTSDEGEVVYRRLSEVPRLTMRESASLAVSKCIYPRLPYPSRSGLLERGFMEMADRDGTVEAFCKVHEHKHDFVRLRYVKEDGLPAFYSPDFLVRTDTNVFLVETKAQGQVSHPNVKRKRTAAVAWCDRINSLSEEQRSHRQWQYVLLGEDVFYQWRDRGALMKALLEYARLRPADEIGQQKLGI